MSYTPDDQNAPGVLEAVAAKPVPVVLAAALGLLIALAATVLLIPERYTATATATIADPQQAAFAGRGALTADYERFVASAATFAESAAVMVRAAATLDGTDAEDLEAAVSVEDDVAGRALKVRATASTAAEAADRANAVVSAFDTEHAAHLGDQAEQTVDALDEQMAAAQTDLDDARAVLNREPDDSAAQTDLEEANAVLGTLRGKRVELTVNAASYGSGVEIVDAAEEPSAPSSPNKRLNLAVGLLAGTLVGMAAVWFSADRRRPLASSDGPRSLIDIPLLGKVPEMKGEDALTDPRHMPAPAYQFVASALRASMDGHGRVVLVGGVGEGSGTTVTTANLAVAAARDTLTVAVVDTCGDEGLAALFGQPEMQAGMLDLIADSEGEVDSQRLTWALGPVPIGGRSVRFLSLGATKRSVAVNEFRSGGARSVLDELRARFDRVFIDCGSVLSSAAAGALAPGADACVLVIPNGAPSDEVVEARERLAVDRVPMAGYVFTRAAQSERRRFRSALLDTAPSLGTAAIRHPELPTPASLPPAPSALPPRSAPAREESGPDGSSSEPSSASHMKMNGAQVWPMPPAGGSPLTPADPGVN